MKAAIDEVQAEKMTQYRAAKLYKIPRQTLNDRLKNKVMSGNVGRPIRLSVTRRKRNCRSMYNIFRVVVWDWGKKK